MAFRHLAGEPQRRSAASPSAPPAAHTSVEKAVLAAALDPIVTIDSRGTIQSVSNSVKRVFGWTPDDLIGQNVSVLMPEPHRSAHDGHMSAYLATGQTDIMGRPREFQGLRRDGSLVPIELCVSRADVPGRDEPVFVGIIRDLTARKQFERERWLVESLALIVGSGTDLDSALESALRCICELTGWDCAEAWTPNGKNGSLEAHWSRPGCDGGSIARASDDRAIRHPDELVGRVWATGRSEVIADLGDAPGAQSPRMDAAREAGVRSAIGVPISITDNTLMVICCFSRAGFDESDEFVKLVQTALAPLGGVIRQRQLLEDLRHREQRLELALDAAAMGAWEWDLQTDTIVWDDRQFSHFGIDRSQFDGRGESVLALIHPDDRPRVDAAIARAKNHRELFREEFRIVRPDGSVRWIAGMGRLFGDDGAKANRMIGVNFDITERKQIEAELVQHRENLEHLVGERTEELRASHEQLHMADRMASIGALAAGLGHDMNNVLLPIRARLNALSEDADENATSAVGRAHIEEIRKSVAYLQQLADGLQFLVMDPDKPSDPSETTNLRSWWAQVGALLSKAVPKHVQVIASIAEDVPDARIPPHRLTQAVLNLVVNAGEAISPKRRRQGRVRVHVEAIDGPEGSRSVRLAVTDNGCGMSDQVRRQAFQMFFTSKPRGLGTGLGLSMVQKVTEQAGGSVEIESEPENGTTVIMTLPAVTESIRPAAAERPRAAISLRDGRASALIRHLLESAGAQVCEGDSPDHADLWVLDPRQTAPNEAKAWHKQHPDGAVIVFGPPAPDARVEWETLETIAIEHPDNFDAVRAALSEALSRP